LKIVGVVEHDFRRGKLRPRPQEVNWRKRKPGNESVRREK